MSNASVHWFNSFIRFIASIPYFDSLIRFIESIHWFDSLIRFIDSIHWFDSLIRFIGSIHWVDSLIRLIISIRWFDSLKRILIVPWEMYKKLEKRRRDDKTRCKSFWSWKQWELNGSTKTVKNFSIIVVYVEKFKKLEKYSPHMSGTGGSRRRQ